MDKLLQNKSTLGALVLILALSFYLYTLSPSLTWGDGTRLQSEAISGESIVLAEMSPQEFSPDPYPFSKVGVTAWDHPLYIVLGYMLVAALPNVDSLWLVNLISAVFGAGTVALIFHLTLRYTNSIVPSLYAACALMVSHTFWWHSSTPEVYTLFTFLLLSSLTFFNRYERNHNLTDLILSALFFGLSASNHILAFLALPALGIYFLLSKRSFAALELNLQKLSLASAAFLAGFALYLVQFARTLKNFSAGELIGPALGSNFLSGLGTLSPIVIGGSLLEYILFLALQFGPIGIVLGVAGFRRAMRSDAPSVRKIAACFIVYALFGIFYRVMDQFAFFLTSYVFFAALMGIGLNHFFSTLREKARIILTVSLLLTILLTPPLYRILPSLAKHLGVDDATISIPQVGIGVRNGLVYYLDPNKRGDYLAYQFGHETLASLPPNAVVLAEWYTDPDEYFILRHFNRVEKLRPDVTVEGWITIPIASFDSQTAVNLIQESISAQRPVYLASLSERFYAASKLLKEYCIVPENNLYRLYPNDRNDLPCLDIDSVTE
ncbi:MAG: DUF2723 domain-containing protein [Anaerolineales bacterium]|nr:DUF2723 domain-containing protein [Anaerolineales bacterium]